MFASAVAEKRPWASPSAAPRQPAAPIEGEEDQVVAQREERSEPEMREVPDRFGSGSILREGRPQEEGEIDTREPELARRAQHGREDERADQPAGEGSLEAHEGRRVDSEREVAAPISARCGSACGKFPRNDPSLGSTSSA